MFFCFFEYQCILLSHVCAYIISIVCFQFRYDEFSANGQTAWDRAAKELEFRIQKKKITNAEFVSLISDIRLAYDARNLCNARLIHRPTTYKVQLLGGGGVVEVEEDEIEGHPKTVNDEVSITYLGQSSSGRIVSVNSVQTMVIQSFVDYKHKRTAYRDSLKIEEQKVQQPTTVDDVGSADNSTPGFMFEIKSSSKTKVDDSDEKDREECLQALFTIYTKSVEMNKGLNWHHYNAMHGGRANLNAADGSAKKGSDITRMELLRVDMGPLYAELAAKPNFETYTPFLMSKLGDNLAESFCERQIHVANQIMTTDRTLLKSENLERLALLRMNVDFIHRMKKSLAPLIPLLDVGNSSDLSVLE